MKNNKVFSIENAQITYRNFRGLERQFNNEGDRNFNLILDDESAEMLKMEGFNVRTRPSRDEDSSPQYLLPVAVSYKNRPPKILLITKARKTVLTEDTVGELDYAEIETIDLTIRPYYWSIPGGGSGVKAYLNSMYVTLLEDEFAERYADIPENV